MSDCSKRQVMTVSDPAWDEVVTIFKNAITNEDEERNCIASALKYIERDIITQLINQSDHNNDEQINFNLTNKDETYNTRKAVILLLDNGFIQKHLLRNSQKRSVWLVNTESAVALQSTTTSEIYIVDPTSTPFGTKPEIALYDKWKDEKSIKRIPEEIKKILPKFEPAISQDDEVE
ncbi:MAG: hypothetical protein OQK76_12480 [Gammaproteobacteria bacterium]|nr:hypothetical protein [Gammaproteobacteria bacterium]MCW8911422.1 hypothetical protein [Gammaproteobacteria bacterium]MCW9003995.1 hypothetical protein [Gammaproteobacteria bacterium]MCW9055703.1 hypothetical protein [Gammaproteobacteria bacterium]